MPHALVHPISFVIAMAIVTYLHVVLGEMVPKNIALAGPDRAVLWLGPFMLGVIWLLKPFVVALNAIANGAVRLARLEPKDEEFLVSSEPLAEHNEIALGLPGQP